MRETKNTKRAKGGEKRKTALQLHVEGLTFKAIGAQLGVTKQRAHQLVQQELAEAAIERKAVAHQALDADLERVDFVLRSMAPLMASDPRAAQTYLKALERRARLLGLDAPTRTDGTTTLTGPDGGAVAIEIAQAEPSALHARLAAAAARATRGADPNGAPPADPAGAAGD